MQLVGRIKKSEVINIIADQSQQLEVTFQIVDTEGEKAQVIAEKKLGFPIDTEKEKVAAQLKQYLENYRRELNDKEVYKERDEQARKATETIEYLQGGVIK